LYLHEEFNVTSERPELNKDDDFQNQWFSMSFSQSGAHNVSAISLKPSTQRPTSETKKISPVRQNIEQIKQFAYDAFDRLDTNKNGFIETDELYAAMNDENTPMREKSYIMFLLTNQKEIAEQAHEGDPEYKDGISRADLELYFRLILSRIA
jgi:hypothetical protein